MTTQNVVIVVVVVVHSSASKSTPGASVDARLTVSNAVSLLTDPERWGRGRGDDFSSTVFEILNNIAYFGLNNNVTVADPDSFLLQFFRQMATPISIIMRAVSARYRVETPNDDYSSLRR